MFLYALHSILSVHTCGRELDIQLILACSRSDEDE